MAYPDNIAPQTPSSTYDVVNVSADGSKPIFVYLKGGAYFTVLGSKSRARIDLPLYDRSTTRDSWDASKMGRGPMSVVTQTGLGSNTVVNGDLLAVAGTNLPFADEIATMMQQDDNFAHVPPHQNVQGQTLIRWFDGAMGAGNVVGECDASRYIDSGGAIPQFIGSAPPNYTPQS